MRHGGRAQTPACPNVLKRSWPRPSSQWQNLQGHDSLSGRRTLVIPPPPSLPEPQDTHALESRAQASPDTGTSPPTGGGRMWRPAGTACCHMAEGSRGPGGSTTPSTRHLRGAQPPCPNEAQLSEAVLHLPMGTVASVLVPEPVRKSPSSVGLSYTHAGKTGRRCPEFFLFCLSRSIFLVSSRDWWGGF